MQDHKSTLARLIAAALVSTLALSAHAQAQQPAGQTQPVAAPAAAQADSSDAAIVEKVKAALKGAPSLANLPIDVSSKDGVVTLAGTVPNEAIEPALKTAATVPGIKEVRSALKAG